MKRFTRFGALLLLLGALILPAHALSAPDEIADLCNDEAWEVLALTNKQRMANGLLPLSTYSTLQQIGNLRADELVTFYSHDRPDGRNCFSALSDFNLTYSLTAENIAAGYTSPDAVVTGWMNSDGHRRNILTPSLIHASMGYTYNAADANGYRSYWAQFFMTGFDCNITAIQALPGSGGLTIPFGGSVEDLDAAVKLTCAQHGASYLPLIEEMCTVSGDTVTVTYDDLSCQLDVTVETAPRDPSQPFTVSDGTFTAEVVYGKATITEFYDPYMHWGITYMNLPEQIGGYPVVGIADGVFSGLYLGDVTLPSTMTEISAGAFRDAEFNSMTFLGKITSVGPSAFSGAGFEGLVLPEGITTIGTNAFEDARFNSMTLPSSIEVIEDRAFYNSSLRTFPDLPDLTFVGKNAFSRSAVSGTVHIPASLTDITPYAFSYMNYVTAFEVDPANPKYISQDGVLYIRDDFDPDILRTLYNYPLANPRTEYTVPETVKMLYCTSFAEAANLETLYVLSPSASYMTYTFYNTNFKVVCSGYSPVYQALSKSGRAEIVPYILSYRDGNRLVFDMSYTFDVAQFYLAAYDADGRMLSIQEVDNIHSSLSWYHNAVVEVYNADKVAKVKLFQFDGNYCPTGEAMPLWGV